MTTSIPMVSDDIERLRQIPLRLPVGDADVYILAESLLGQRRGERFEQAPTTDTPSTTLSLALARLTAIGLLRFLWSQGSERPARALRPHGERVVVVDVALSGNDDDGAAGGLDLRCSDAWPAAIWRLAKDVMPVIERRRGAGHEPGLQGLGRTERQRLRELLGARATATGDHVAFACAHEHLARLGLPTSFETFIGRGMATASPFAHLYRLDDPDAGTLDAAALLRPPLVRLVELCGPGLGAAWAKALKRSISHSADIDELTARARALSRSLLAFVQAADLATRLDLLEGVVGFLCALPAVLPEDTRPRLVRLPGVVSMADRDRVVTAVAGAFEVLDHVDAVVRTLQSSRFGDERFTEARTVAAILTPLQEARPAIEAARKALTGVVG